MRLAPTLAAMLLATGVASAATPDDTFLAAIEACQAMSAASIADSAVLRDAPKMDPADVALARLSWYNSMAMGYLHTDMDAARIEAEPLPAIDYRGWQIGQVRVMLMSSPQTNDRVCQVSTTEDKYDAAKAKVSAGVGNGQPAREFKIGPTRIAAWKLKVVGSMPGIMLSAGDMGGQGATSVQVTAE